MSVRAGDRSEGKIQAVDASRQLVEYTYDRVHDKTFSKSDRWLMAKTIWDDASLSRVKLLRANSIRKHLESIHLELNEKTALYPLRQGIRFLQWRFILTDKGGVRMRMGSDKQGRERRRLSKLAQKEIQGKIKPGTTRNSYESWVANAQRGDTYFQVKRMESYFENLERMIENGNNSRKDPQSGT